MDVTPLLISFLTFYGIYLILALSLNLEYGYTGLPNFGKVFFFSVGAYVAAVFTGHLLNLIAGVELDVCHARAAAARERFAAGAPFVIALVFAAALAIAAFAGAAFGYLLSYPALRVREVYLALLLLVVAEISRVYVRSTPAIICGPHGLGGIPNPLSWMPYPHLRYLLYAGLVLLIALACYVFCQRLVNTPYGRALKAMRDDEEAAAALGKHIARRKAQVMAIGSAWAAVAGALYAFYAQFVGTEDFVPILTFMVLAMVVLGGAANNLGVVIGVLVLTAVDRFTRPSVFAMLGLSLPFDVTYLRYAFTGLLLALLVMFRPQGLFPERALSTPAWSVVRRREAP